MRRSPRALLAVLAALVGIVPAVAVAGAPPAAAWPAVERVAGADRFATAAAVSARTYSSPVPVAFVATGLDWADALAGAPAAGAGKGPMLLVTRTAVPKATAEELSRLRPAKIVVLGGTSAVGAEVATALGRYAGTVERIAGRDRYETAAKVSASTFASKRPTVYVATGQSYADALSAGAVAAMNTMPLLLVQHGSIPPVIAEELRRLDAENVVVVGGTNVVSDAVVDALGGYARGTVLRFSGRDRYETSARVSALSFSAPRSTVFLATGEDFPDALAGAPAAGRGGAPVLLVRKACMSEAVAQEVQRLAPAKVVVLGGTSAVSDSAAKGSTDCPLPPAPQAPRYWGSSPIVAGFYYGWYPSGFETPGTRFTPSAGRYDTQDLTTVRRQIDQMRYGGMRAGIASWWGAEHEGPQANYAAWVTDRSLKVGLQAAQHTPFTWTIYYEPEGYGNPSVAQLRSHLDYVRANYVNHTNWLWMDGKPVVFVWPDPNDTCEMVGRWQQAAPDFYVVHKRFRGWENCRTGASSWHEYAPGLREISNMKPWSYSVSAGYWQYNEAPRLARDPGAYDAAVGRMRASGAHWQLVTTFNEWGEGTAVEPAAEWASPSGYGVYLDILHRHYGRF